MKSTPFFCQPNMRWSHNMIHSHFTLYLRAHDYKKRLSQHPWYGLWMRVKALHHYKVTALGSSVKWPLLYTLSYDKDKNRNILILDVDDQTTMYVLHPRAPMFVYSKLKSSITWKCWTYSLRDKLISDRVTFDMISWKWKYVAQICCLVCSERASLGFLDDSRLIGNMPWPHVDLCHVCSMLVFQLLVVLFLRRGAITNIPPKNLTLCRPLDPITGMHHKPSECLQCKVEWIWAKSGVVLGKHWGVARASYLYVIN